MVKIQNKAHFFVFYSIICCCVSYILGGSNTVREFYSSNVLHKSEVIAAVLLITFALTCVGFKKFGIEQKIFCFDWEAYFDQFKERYHWNRFDVILLIIALLLGGGMRIAGYNWGITSVFQPDEGKLVIPAADMAISRSLYSENFYYPSQFLSKFAAILIYIYSRCSGEEIYTRQLPQAFFIFRIIVVMAGTATIFICFLIGNYFKKHVGAILSILVSCFPVYVQLSKQVTGDVSSFFFLSITVLFSLRYMEKQENKFLVFMAMGAAMATLEKWHGAVGIGYIGFIILLNSKQLKKIMYKGIYALGAYVAWILLLCPNMIFHLRTAIIDGFINIAVYDGHKGAPYHQVLLNYGKYGIQHYGGIIYILVLVLGIIYFIFHFDRKYMILLIGILKTLILCLLNRSFKRWGLELYFCELLLVSFAIYWMTCLFRKHFNIIGYGMAFVIVMDFLSGSIVNILIATHSYNDTRLIQQEECLAAGITPDNSVSAYYTGFVPGGGSNSIVGYVPREAFSDYFVIEDGELYRKSEELEFAIINTTLIVEEELVEAIIEECPVVYSYDSIYPDVCWDPLSSIKLSYNDIELIYNNIYVSADVVRGALTGMDIEVCDVKEIPVIPNRNDS